MNYLQSATWKPLSPLFITAYKHLIASDKFSKRCFDDILAVNPQDFRCLRDDHDHSVLLAMPIKVTKSSANVFGTMHGGMLLTLVDDCTSFHIIDRLLPKCPGHVSVQLSGNFVSSASVGDEILAVSKIDKLGRSLVYTSIAFYKASSKAAEEALTKAATLERVEDALRVHGNNY